MYLDDFFVKSSSMYSCTVYPKWDLKTKRGKSKTSVKCLLISTNVYIIHSALEHYVLRITTRADTFHRVFHFRDYTRSKLASPMAEAWPTLRQEFPTLPFPFILSPKGQVVQRCSGEMGHGTHQLLLHSAFKLKFLSTVSTVLTPPGHH